MTNQTFTPQETSTTDAMIIEAVASGSATTRSDLSTLLKLSPSTVSVRVQALLENNVLREAGAGKSKGGRRPQVLETAGTPSTFAAIDMGGAHVRFGVFDTQGNLLASWEASLDLSLPPRDVLSSALDSLTGADLDVDLDATLRGISLGVPAPVNQELQRIDVGARMARWTHFPIREWMESHIDVPVAVENDANLMALGEARHHPEIERSITVKAGAAIGSGIVVDGKIYHGASGMAGDISHVRSHRSTDRPCGCGNIGCLETIASGVALVERARANGMSITSLPELVARAHEGDSAVTTLIRDAGRALGEVLCSVVGFANPNALFVGGRLSTLEIFIASIRSELYGGCHPLVTRNLLISQATLGADAGIYGGFELIRDTVFHLPDLIH